MMRYIIQMILKVTAGIAALGVIIWAIDTYVVDPLGETVAQQLTEPIVMGYNGFIKEYDIRISGQSADINVIEFINTKGEHCMIGMHRGAPFSMICANH